MKLITRFPIAIKIFSTELGKAFCVEFRWIYYVEYPPISHFDDISGMLKAYEDF